MGGWVGGWGGGGLRGDSRGGDGVIQTNQPTNRPVYHVEVIMAA